MMRGPRDQATCGSWPEGYDMILKLNFNNMREAMQKVVCNQTSPLGNNAVWLVRNNEKKESKGAIARGWNLRAKRMNQTKPAFRKKFNQ